MIYQAKKFLRQTLINVQNKVLRLFSYNGFLASIYYLVFSTSFYREHLAVLQGKLKYQRSLKTNSSNYYQLIRNTHRIEKGLLMRPRRKVFALDYIEETILCFEKQWNLKSGEMLTQLKWSQDVLSLYFDVTEGNDIIEREKKRFKKIIHNNEIVGKNKSIPYHKIKLTDIRFEDFYNLTLQRRSTRWFLKKKVPRELIDKAILAAIQSPSACNRQPFEYRVIDDMNLLNKVVHLPGGTAGYADNISVMIVVIGNLDAYFSERDRHLIYIDASLANMTLMFALETLGLSSCAINWPDVEAREKKMDDLLRLGKHQRPIMAVALGYAEPEALVAHSAKKDLDKIRTYN